MNYKIFAHLLEDFIKERQKQDPLIMLLDNASFQKSKYLEEKPKEWKEKEVYLQFIPAYCLKYLGSNL